MASRPRKRRRGVQPPLLAEPTGFTSLSKAEQIRYLQALWDSISERPGEVPVPESHLILAEERLAEYRRDPSRARHARDVFDRLTTPDPIRNPPRAASTLSLRRVPRGGS